MTFANRAVCRVAPERENAVICCLPRLGEGRSDVALYANFVTAAPECPCR
jgi:hypothetical protein